MKKFLKSILLCFLLTSCSAYAGPQQTTPDYNQTFQVTFCDADQSVLYIDYVKYGGTAHYFGPTPTKESTKEYIVYTFKEWTDSLSNITCNKKVYPVFNEIIDINNPYFTNGRFKFSSVEGGYEITEFYGWEYGFDQGNNRGKINEIRTGCLILPTMYNDRPVISIGDKAFYEKTHFTFIKFPKYLKTIGIDAFYGSFLNEIIFNEGLQSIGKDAFKDNVYVSKIVFPSTLTTIGNWAFKWVGLRAQQHISSIFIPNSVTEIGDEVFYTVDYGYLFTLNCEAKSKPLWWSDSWNLANEYGMGDQKGVFYHYTNWGCSR